MRPGPKEIPAVIAKLILHAAAVVKEAIHGGFIGRIVRSGRQRAKNVGPAIPGAARQSQRLRGEPGVFGAFSLAIGGAEVQPKLVMLVYSQPIGGASG